MSTRNVAALATAALMLVGSVSCGSDSEGSSPDEQTTTVVDDSTAGPDAEGDLTADDLADGMVKGLNVAQERAACAAETVLASDLPEASKAAIANTDPDSISEEEMSEVQEVLGDALTACP